MESTQQPSEQPPDQPVEQQPTQARGSHLAEVGVPDHEWSAVVRHRVWSADRKWIESTYRRRFESRNCIQPDLSGHPDPRKRRRATIFISTDSQAERKTLLTILNHRGWDDVTDEWLALDLSTTDPGDDVFVCPGCFSILGEGEPCSNTECDAYPGDDADGTDPGPWTADRILALSWHDLRREVRTRGLGATGSRGDLLRRLGRAVDVSSDDLGLVG